MWYKRIRKFFCVSAVILGIANFGSVLAMAAEAASDVSIQLVGEPCIEDSGMTVSVQVSFEDMSFYNDKVYLSYHILDEEGQAVITENERIKIDMEQQTIQQLELEIDLSNAKSITGDDRLVIEFDIVDEKNAFWFSTNESMNFATIKVSSHRTIGQKLLYEMSESKVIFGLNALVFVGSIIAATYIYKKVKVS